MATKCGCAYCTNRPETEKGRVYDAPNATHQEIFRRLAGIKNMHGTPGQPKGKGGRK